MIKRMMASAIALTSAAYAQTPPPAPATESADCAPTPQCAVATSARDRLIYDAAFFAQYNPQSALDMVRQTPGFTLDGGDDRRGFSGAVGNLLIDGVRPTSKSQSLDGILSRIPAAQVVRVEVLRGAEVAGDASGQSVLLNVVRTASAGSGLWEIGAEFNVDDPAPRGEASYTGRNGSVEYGAGISVYSQRRSLPGWRYLTNASDALVGTVDTPSPRNYREASMNGNVALPLAGGRLSATGQVDWNRFHADNGLFFFDAAGDPARDFIGDFTEQNRGFEVGLNYDRDFGPWSLALVGLVNRHRYNSDEFDSLTPTGGTTTLQTQAVRQKTGESILRGTLARPLGSAQRIELGLEGAYNSLDQGLAFSEDTGGGPSLIPIPNSNVLVEEDRFEAFASHTWRPAPDWSLETRLAWETSTLTFTGDANNTVDLSFWKPSVQLTRSFGGNDQVRLRVYRDVGQLNFGDFVSAANVADNLIAGGNPDLAPQTDWRIELGGDLRFQGGAALSLTLTKHYFSDVADLVKITIPNPPDPDIVFDAPGNIGDAEELSLDVNFSSPVAFIPGGRVTVTGFLRDNAVTDPITGRERIISNRLRSRFNLEFRQDLNAQRLAWGVSASKDGQFQSYRFNEIDTNEEGPYVDGFIESTALPNNLRLRLTAANMFHGTINRDRAFFAPDRAGDFSGRDLRKRHFEHAPWLILQLSGSF